MELRQNISELAAQKHYEFMEKSKDYSKLCKAYSNGYLQGASDKTKVMLYYFEDKKEELLDLLNKRFGGIINIKDITDFIKQM